MPRGLVVLLGTAAAAVVVVAGMKAAAWLLALVIVIVTSPVHRWLRRHGIPAWCATLAVTVVGVYVAINFVLQSLVQPRFVGDAVGLSSTLTFVSLAFWAWAAAILRAPQRREHTGSTRTE